MYQITQKDPIFSLRERADNISELIKDYRVGEIKLIDQDHVMKWLKQFNEADQLIIAEEIEHIIKQSYLSKNSTIDLLKKMLKTDKIFGDIQTNYPNIKFMRVSRKGSSQNDLLKLIEIILKEDYGIDIEMCGTSPKKYIYIDDCIYSGNTVYYDLKNWLEENNELVIEELHTVFLASYLHGYSSFKNKRMPALLKELNLDINFQSSCWQANYFKNYSKYYSSYNCCWPLKINEQDKNEDVLWFEDYLENQFQSSGSKISPRKYRTKDNLNDSLFTSKKSRAILERAFLEKGAYITTLPKKLPGSMRPLGFEKYHSLGFGSLFFTYRNIANNCPLVLWWGDSDYEESHPFSKWHPLLPRKINGNASVIFS